MADSTRDTRLLWALVALGVVLALALLWVWNLGNTLSSLDQRGQQLEARFAAVPSTDALAAIEKRQSELETRLADLDLPDIAPLQQQVAELKSTLDTLETRFGDFTVPGLDALTARLAAVETAVAAIQPTDLTTIDQSVAGLRADVDGLKTQLGELAPARVDDLATRLDTLSQQITTSEGELKTRLDAFAARLAAVNIPDVAPIETRLGVLTSDVATLKTDVAAAATSEQVGVLETRLAAAATTDQLGALETRVGAVGAEAAQSTAAIASVQTETAALSTQIGEVSAALTTKAASAELTSLSEQLETLKTEVAALPTTDAASFATDVAALRTDLDALGARVAALPPADAFAALRTDVDKLVANPPAARPPQIIERIYFGSSGTRVGADELGKIAALAQRLQGAPATLDLVGFSDSKGPAELNRSISLRRAAAVRLALIQAGVDPAAVTSVVGLGEDAPPIDAGDDADEAGNRVVLVYAR